MNCIIGLERPRFGQFARQVAPIRAEQLAECLVHQSRTGARLGQILLKKRLLSREQVRQVLTLQARWVASVTRADLRLGTFPYPALLSVCMPAFNERENIEDTLDAACSILPEFVERLEVVVVDDGSADGTGDVVARYALLDPRVRLVRHAQNRGYGAAVTSGLRAARGDLVMFTDSDGQFSFLDLPQLLIRLGEHDVVIGYRYRRVDSRMRLLNARGWNMLIRLFLGVSVKDLDCAFKLFRREIIDRLHMTATGAVINAEIMAQCLRSNLNICEVPVTHHPRYSGVPTGAAPKVILKAFRELPRLWQYRSAFPHCQMAAGSGDFSPHPDR